MLFYSNKVTPYRVGFDKWDVEIIDSDLPNKISRIVNDSTVKTISDGKENRSPNVTEQTIAIESMDVYDSFGVKVTTNNSHNLANTIYNPCTNSAMFTSQHSHEVNCNDVSISNTKQPEILRNMKKVPLLLSGKYFEIQHEENDLIKACCKICKKVYSAARNVTSNLVTHLKVCIYD